MKTAIFFLMGVVFLGCSHTVDVAQTLSDEPKARDDLSLVREDKTTYGDRLKSWQSPDEINAWIGRYFTYDMSRAMLLSETQRKNRKGLSIYSPAAFYERKKGICVDLSRFSVETLKAILPSSDPKYLMIKFDPLEINGNVLRLHWMASFKRKGGYYFFGDSKRPGLISGPYRHLRQFIDEYEKFRNRKIISFKLLDSYKKTRKIRLKRKVKNKK